MKTYNTVIIGQEKEENIKLQNLIEEFCISLNIIINYNSIHELQMLLEKEEAIGEPIIAFVNFNKDDKFIIDFVNKMDRKNIILIFLISHEQNKIEGIKYDAIDFLLKPLEIKNLILAVNKAIKQIELNNTETQLFSNKNLEFQTNYNRNFVAVSSIDKIDIIKCEDIMFCMAEGKYTNFFLKSGSKVMSSKNLGEYEHLLTNQLFFRIHHSYLVNISHLKMVNKKEGTYCVLSNGVNLPVAKRRLDAFNRFILIKN